MQSLKQMVMNSASFIKISNDLSFEPICLSLGLYSAGKLFQMCKKCLHKDVCCTFL